MLKEQGVDLLGERSVGKCYVQGLLCALRLGWEPIEHMGKYLRHLFISLKLTYCVMKRNHTPSLCFCCCQLWILLSTLTDTSLFVFPGLNRRSQNEDSGQGFGEVYDGPLAS